ncbi:hypothetical protein K504DRAFT_70015 [Pleomassaria siparia CBS 279.74]|uniref:Uncharacterized protein n=1 Tax=Pleomassaria siparia CBS 279.74 TaxID=1314801 RepID=A0A6G1K2Z6_9PLEO|nr:hypothetical protein K504DRAFT_70015 [Pleomassaria siparia CBS 279.74]
MMDSHIPPSRLLGLPTELRYAIYDHLNLGEPVCYPFPASPITSISHGPPPGQLLVICSQIRDEIRAHYYGRVTFRLMALGSSQINRSDISAKALSVLRQAKKVELVMVWNLSPQRESADPATWPWWMTEWLHDQVRLLKEEGHKLDLVIVSLRDVSLGENWEMKKKLLAPLQVLKGRARLKVQSPGADITEKSR